MSQQVDSFFYSNITSLFLLKSDANHNHQTNDVDSSDKMTKYLYMKLCNVALFQHASLSETEYERAQYDNSVAC